MAWQFDCPETGEGLVQAFRREESPEASARPRLVGLDPNAIYTSTNLDIADATEMTGRELLETGLPLSIPDRPGAVITIYAKKEGTGNKKESPQPRRHRDEALQRLAAIPEERQAGW